MNYCKAPSCHALQPLDKRGYCAICSRWEAFGSEIPARPTYDWYDKNSDAYGFMTQAQHECVRQDRERQHKKAVKDFYAATDEIEKRYAEMRIFKYRGFVAP